MEGQRPKNMRSKRFSRRNGKQNYEMLNLLDSEICENEEEKSENEKRNNKLPETVDHSLKETSHTSQSLEISYEEDNKYKKHRKLSTACQEEEKQGLIQTFESLDIEDDTKERDEFAVKKNKEMFERGRIKHQQRSSNLEDRRETLKKSAENKQSNGTTHQQNIEGYLEKDDQIDKSEVRCFECIQAIPVTSANEIKPGDHVVVCGLIYDHHGIIIEKDGEEFIIAEATNTAFKAVLGTFRIGDGKAEIKQSEKKKFDFTKERICVVQYKRRFSPDITIHKAKNADRKYDYHIFRNNCEHFATKCVTGQSISVQVSKLRLAWKLFWSSGFGGINDEVKRNEKGFKKKMICEPCYKMNKEILGVKKTPITFEEDIKEGDIIRYRYWHLWHDAVVLEIIEKTNNHVVCFVAHYDFCGPFSLRTIKRDQKTIQFDKKSYKLDYALPKYDVYHPDQVVTRAKDCIGEQWFALFSNDSSHFARWCKLKLKYEVVETGCV